MPTSEMRVKIHMYPCVLFILLLLFSAPVTAGNRILQAPLVETPPVIDGYGNDRAWKKGREISVHDAIADLDVSLVAVHTTDSLYIRIVFPDPDESRTHKSWLWDRKNAIYTVGDDREDTFVFKWNMEAGPVDLSLQSDTPYSADIWYWKACRTDPSGYADDKMHILGPQEKRNSTPVTSRSGRQMFLQRIEDEGQSAYRTTLAEAYGGDTLPRFENRPPLGSRADVEAKGSWQSGRWTIEFARALKTGNPDDLQFAAQGAYLFGISRFEIAGRPRNDRLSQPLFGSGDIGEPITLLLQ